MNSLTCVCYSYKVDYGPSGTWHQTSEQHSGQITWGNGHPPITGSLLRLCEQMLLFIYSGVDSDWPQFRLRSPLSSYYWSERVNRRMKECLVFIGSCGTHFESRKYVTIINFWLKIIFHYQGNVVFQFSMALALTTRKPKYLYILPAQSICLCTRGTCLTVQFLSFVVSHTK